MTTTHGARPSSPAEQQEWDAGYNYAFYDDGFISWGRYRYYSEWFIRGYETGKYELNQVIDAYRQPREY